MLPSRIHSFQRNATGSNRIQIAGYASCQFESSQESKSLNNARLSQCSQKAFRRPSASSSHPGIYQFLPGKKKRVAGITPRRINGTQDNVSNGRTGRFYGEGSAYRSASKEPPQGPIFDTRTGAIPSQRSTANSPENLSVDRHDNGRTERSNFRPNVGQSGFAAWAVRLHRSRAGINQQTANCSTYKIGNHCSLAYGHGNGSNALCNRIHGTANQKYQTSIQRSGRKSGYLLGNTSHPETFSYIVAGRGQYFCRSDIGHDGNASQYSTQNLSKVLSGLSGKCGRFVGENLQFYKPVCKTRKVECQNNARLTAANPRSIYSTVLIRGRSSVGRAPRSQRGGQGFDSPRLHQIKTRRLMRRVFCFRSEIHPAPSIRSISSSLRPKWWPISWIRTWRTRCSRSSPLSHQKSRIGAR